MTKPNWMMEDEVFKAIWEAAAPFTMTSPERAYALYKSVRYVVESEIPGAFVECGAWRGGSAMIVALTLVRLGSMAREIYIFDTFDGMTAPSEKDVDLHGNSAAKLLDETADDRKKALIWAVCGLPDVQANMAKTAYPPERIRYIEGDVRLTAACTLTGPIALLRLDTDFHDSTLAELTHLYPKLVENGVLIIDDYGHWEGAKAAVDEYFGVPGNAARPMLWAADYTGRVGVRPDAPKVAPESRYDYVPPGLIDPSLQAKFPSLIIKDPDEAVWPYLRKEVPHRWRVDSRSTKPNIGVLSYEEAVLLHNFALPFKGRRGLEIGCHLAWSTAHLAAAGLHLDVIDPALGVPRHRAHVEGSLEACGLLGHVSLFEGFSPSIVDAVAALNEERWSFVFIDGLHDGDAPRQDAVAVSEHMAPTAAIAFHDLAAPPVARGLEALREMGWQVRVYQTMQVMGLAWRGSYEPPEHVMDPYASTVGIRHLVDIESSRVSHP